MPSNTPGLNVSYKPGTPNDTLRLMPRGIRQLIALDTHPDDMSQPCQQWLARHNAIAPAGSGSGWKWTSLGANVVRSIARSS